MEYDYYKEQKKGAGRKKAIIGMCAAGIVAIVAILLSLYMQYIQLQEIGRVVDIFIKNLQYRIAFFAVVFVLLFIVIYVTNIFVRRNLQQYLQKNGLPKKHLPNLLTAIPIAVLGALLNNGILYPKMLTYLHAVPFGKTDPIFHKDIGYYMFQRPFLLGIYEFLAGLMIFVILYTAAYYLLVMLISFQNIRPEDVKTKMFIRHNLINVALFFAVKAFSYRFQSEGVLYNSFDNLRGASYIDIHIWLKYFTAAPFILLVIVLASLFLIWNGKLRKAAYVIALYPAVWIVVSLLAWGIQGVVVKPNLMQKEGPYIENHMVQTRAAFGLDSAKSYEMPGIEALTPEIIQRNQGTMSNIRVVDFQPTLDSNIQLQSNANFYTFANGNIVNYTINGEEMPVFISAREIDSDNLPNASYINKTFRYTHGYGIVINPINQLTGEGQIKFYVSGLKMQSVDPSLQIKEPRIYYGELTNNHVIVNPPEAGMLKEIDYDGKEETSYAGQGGIRLNPINRLLFALTYRDPNILITNYISGDSRLLLNRNVVERAQKGVPFLQFDQDPYIIPTSDGRLKWVIDAYSVSDAYPYAQTVDGFNYLRNSVKVVIDAYDGTVDYYIVDPNDPIIATYDKIYPGIFRKDALPEDIAKHMKYPEYLFDVQTRVLQRYHLDPGQDDQAVNTFFGNQDLWQIANLPNLEDGNLQNADSSDVVPIDPSYNMIKLPSELGEQEELILMRPFTASNKDNMIAWLAVRNSAEHYGQLILLQFPNNTNIYGPRQVEVKINQIDKVSKDISLWGQRSSRVFKGSLLAIPIENSILYVEPIYIQTTGKSSIPEVREIVTGFQNGDEFKYGIGTNLEASLKDLMDGTPVTTETPGTGDNETPPDTSPPQGTDKDQLIQNIIGKYEALKKQLDEMGQLIDALGGSGQ